MRGILVLSDLDKDVAKMRGGIYGTLESDIASSEHELAFLNTHERTDVRGSPGTDARGSPGTDVRGSPGTDARGSLGTDARRTENIPHPRQSRQPCTETRSCLLCSASGESDLASKNEEEGNTPGMMLGDPWVLSVRTRRCELLPMMSAMQAANFISSMLRASESDRISSDVKRVLVSSFI
ncbi:hypothetical protein PG995_006236 [Apiospora arundinis]